MSVISLLCSALKITQLREHANRAETKHQSGPRSLRRHDARAPYEKNESREDHDGDSVT